MIGLLLAATLTVPTPTRCFRRRRPVDRRDGVFSRIGCTSRPPKADTIDSLAVQQAVRAMPQLRVAVLPAAAVAEAGGNPAAVPGDLSARIGRGGTVLVLVGDDLEAASTTLGPTDVHDALITAQAAGRRRQRFPDRGGHRGRTAPEHRQRAWSR